MIQKFKQTHWRAQAGQILQQAGMLCGRSYEELHRSAVELSWRIRAGSSFRSVITDVFALVCESARRTTGLLPYPVQVMAGIALAEGRIVEMQTGEGKTLTATLPATLYAMAGRGCHVVTVNDYLARRDAEWMKPIFELLGLSVGCVESQMQHDERRAAYSCHITYGTAMEMGFDFLRDRLHTDVTATTRDRTRYTSSSDVSYGVVQRGHHFALIDEADSVLIDEAGTPLIIGITEPNTIPEISLLHWAQSLVRVLDGDRDYVTETDRRLVTLTETGSRRVLMLDRPYWLGIFSNEKLLSQVEVALAARLFYERDREYTIKDGNITIVDESTGRMMEARKWQRGLHQAIEIKEELFVTEDTKHAAQITIQSFFRHYRQLAGMTGTVWQARHELKAVYQLNIARISTHRPCLRQELPCRVWATDTARNCELTKVVDRLLRNQRAVLIGTPSVTASETLGEALAASGIPYVILNARHEEREAQIVSEAGQPGRVTIATNMAGRGTDIIPHKLVVRQGGLHVIATSMHSSARIDQQLVGRTARQGDPGTFQFLLSLEDPFLQVLPPRTHKHLQQLAASLPNGAGGVELQKYFLQVQRQMEKIHSRQRKQMLRREKEQHKTFRRIGLDPWLESAVD